MATVFIAALTYQPVGPRGDQWAAQVPLAISTDYKVSLQSATGRDNEAIPIRYAVVDNIGGSTAVIVTMGTVSFAVPPFTRETLTLPGSLQFLGVTVGSGGGVTLTLSDGKLISDQSNFLSIQQTAAATLTYPFVAYSVDTVQAASDLNKTALFTPTVANMAYTLMLGSSAGNGWLEFCYNNGTKNVTLTPSGGNTINGAASLVLRPGDNVILQSDGANWYAIFIPISNALILALSQLAPAAGWLQNDGANVLSWSTPPSGGMTLLGSVADFSGASPKTVNGLNLTSYVALYISIKAWATSAAASRSINGATLSGSILSMNAVLWIDLNSGAITGGGDMATAVTDVTTLTNASTSVSFTAGNTGTGGSAKVYGVK